MAEAQTVAPADPISRIDAILASESAPPPKATEPEAQPTEQQPEVPTQPDTPEEQPTGEPQVEGDDAPAATPAEMAEIPLDQLEAITLEVTTKGVDGVEVSEKPTIKELKLGYMRTKDYERKTQEVARQREKLGEESRQAADSERTRYVQDLQVLQATLMETVAPELQGVNWNELASNDAFQYVKLRNRADQITQANAAIQAKINEATAKSERETKAENTKKAAEAREILQRDIPDWSDVKYQSLMKAGETYGYTAEEVGKWLDPRAIKVLHDAQQFRQAQTVKAPVPVVKKVAIPPKVLKPGVPALNAQAQQRTQSAMANLAKSGTIRDAAAAIQLRLK